jgi:hypothetical protein
MLQKMGQRVRGASKAKDAVPEGSLIDVSKTPGDSHYSKTIEDETKPGREKSEAPGAKKPKTEGKKDKEKVKQTVIVQAPGEDVNDDTYEVQQMIDQVRSHFPVAPPRDNNTDRRILLRCPHLSRSGSVARVGWLGNTAIPLHG